jgi:uncharacterized protein (TIGR02118 family)
MVKLTVLYPRQEGASFDMQYYREAHLPLVRRLLGSTLKGLSVDEGLEGGVLPAPYRAICELTFDSAEAMQAAVAEHVAALSADIPNYTTIKPMFQASTVLDV